jgi:hypothetical protein
MSTEMVAFSIKSERMLRELAEAARARREAKAEEEAERRHVARLMTRMQPHRDALHDLAAQLVVFGRIADVRLHEQAGHYTFHVIASERFGDIAWDAICRAETVVRDFQRVSLAVGHADSAEWTW